MLDKVVPRAEGKEVEEINLDVSLPCGKYEAKYLELSFQPFLSSEGRIHLI